MNVNSELSTLTTILDDIAARLTTLVELHGENLTTDSFQELVSAERSAINLRRRLSRLQHQLS